MSQINKYVIYKITCLKNNKVYIGQTCRYKDRKINHLYQLRHNIHDNHYLQEDYNRFGESVFVFEVIKECENKESSLIEEADIIDSYGGIESNLTYNYKNKYTNNSEMKQKLIGKSLSEEHKQHIKDSCKKLLGDNNPAKRPEVRAKISAANKIIANENPNHGMKNKKHSEETKRKMSEHSWNKGSRKYTQEFIQQLRSEYSQLGSYLAVSRLHPNINSSSISNLIRFGLPGDPKCYK